jgi:hypothetical protein
MDMDIEGGDVLQRSRSAKMLRDEKFLGKTGGTDLSTGGMISPPEPKIFGTKSSTDPSNRAQIWVGVNSEKPISKNFPVVRM